MKKTLKAFLIIAGLAGGTAVFAQGPYKQVNFTASKGISREDVSSSATKRCYPTSSQNIVCEIDKDDFKNLNFTVLEKGGAPCIFNVNEGGQISGPLQACGRYGPDSVITQVSPDVITIRFN